MKDKIRKIREGKGYNRTEFEELTGVTAKTWANIELGKQKANEDHLRAITAIWPEYALWLLTDKTNEECGQISPEVEVIREKLKTGT
ncbi:MAG: helix-turn-helix transcriptional regulator [Patescibacteria group bacterium]|nr:helix-turn-helix transcriptional regulator [Patescibacteria group bacterium]